MQNCSRTHHDAMPHHSKLPSPHECCKRKSKPKTTHASMVPCCPPQEGTLPRTCGMAEVSCCAIVGRDETRRTAKPEKTSRDQKPVLVEAEYQTRSAPVLERRDRHLRDGLRYEKPVFDLKTDLRI